MYVGVVTVAATVDAAEPDCLTVLATGIVAPRRPDIPPPSTCVAFIVAPDNFSADSRQSKVSRRRAGSVLGA